MDNIIEPTIDYDFSKLYLGPPTTLAGGAYFTRIMYSTNKQLLIQTPKSLTKQGFIKSGKKIYTDLMFDNNDTVFINWIENLETKCQELIFSKGQNWFETKLEKDDIESAFTSPFKIFKSGKYYLLRVNVKQNIKIYDEQDQIITSEDITSDKTIISILEIQGIKFTSRNFQLEFELKQAMAVSPDPFLDECFIKKPIKRLTAKETIIKEQDEDELEKDELDNPKEILTTTNLDDFINKSANDLAKNVKTLDTKNIPIDLEVSFDEPKKVVENNVTPLTNVLDGLEEANIVLDIEELTPEPEPEEKEDPNILKEFDLSSTLENNLETITLKKPNQVYYEIYQKAREKAKEAKKSAIVAYLEMKNIKKTYMLDDIDESDSEFDDFSGRDSASEVSDVESLEDTFD
jgi:rRNA-processing protein FCF1